MGIKKILGGLFTIVGAIALIVGVAGIFKAINLAGNNHWMFAILGLVFFIAGLRLLNGITTVEKK